MGLSIFLMTILKTQWQTKGDEMETITVHKIDNKTEWYATSDQEGEYKNVPIPTPYSIEYWQKETIVKKIQTLNPNSIIK